MTKQVILLHDLTTGDAIAARTPWMDAWQLGLKRSSLSAPDAHMRFVSYADLLSPEPPGEDAALDDAGAAEFLSAVLEQAAARYDVIHFQSRSAIAREKVQRLLEAFAAADVPSVQPLVQMTSAVYRYRNDAALRARILQRLTDSIDAAHPVIVVAHGFGSILAYDLLDDEIARQWQVPLLVTLGSPLGVAPIRDAFGAARIPGNVSRWCNGRDPLDLVALYPLDADHFPLEAPAAILDKSDLLNRTVDHHAIQGYFNDPEVIRWIHFALR